MMIRALLKMASVTIGKTVFIQAPWIPGKSTHGWSALAMIYRSRLSSIHNLKARIVLAWRLSNHSRNGINNNVTWYHVNAHLCKSFGGHCRDDCPEHSGEPAKSRDDWIRTSGLFVPNEARYRAALHPVEYLFYLSRRPSNQSALAAFLVLIFMKDWITAAICWWVMAAIISQPGWPWIPNNCNPHSFKKEWPSL